MRYRPRWGLLGLGAVVVVLLFTFPLWRVVFQRPGQTVRFPLTDPARREVFINMSDPNMAATAYGFSLTAVPVPTEQQPEPVPEDAQAIFEGTFGQIDAVHSAKGTVTLYRLVDDRVLIRFEEFEVTNAPGLSVFLSRSEGPTADQEAEFIISEEYKVGELRGSLGAQQFIIPRELPLDRYQSVVLISEPLQVIYSFARLQ